MVRLYELGLGITPLERVEVAPIVEKIVENKLRWFEHVVKRLCMFVRIANKRFLL